MSYKNRSVLHFALVIVFALLFQESGIAANVNTRPLTSSKSKSQNVSENQHARRRMTRLARSRAARTRYARHRRHRYYERFYTNSFAEDLTEGDVTAGEDPIVRQAAMDALGNMNGTVVAVEPTSGRVLLDDVDLHTYSVTHLRQQFAVIGQEPVLFSATVADNISYGRFDASRDEIIAAAVAAHAHEFITSLPRGYETRIGDGGSRLSGGQRQRLSIARAFLKNAPILILDEPTSALDAATESELLDSLHHVMEGRTAFVIAHRLNTIRDCDLLLMLEKGKLKEMRWRTEEPISVAAEMLAR